MTVIITDFAWETLQGIYKHYLKVAAYKADEILEELIDRTKQLEYHPLSGPAEPFYTKCGFNYRFLVHGNFKIIYKVERDMVFIMRFFDARQSPEKMLKSEE